MDADKQHRRRGIRHRHGGCHDRVGGRRGHRQHHDRNDMERHCRTERWWRIGRGCRQRSDGMGDRRRRGVPHHEWWHQLVSRPEARRLRVRQERLGVERERGARRMRIRGGLSHHEWRWLVGIDPVRCRRRRRRAGRRNRRRRRDLGACRVGAVRLERCRPDIQRRVRDDPHLLRLPGRRMELERGLPASAGHAGLRPLLPDLAHG